MRTAISERPPWREHGACKTLEDDRPEGTRPHVTVRRLCVHEAWGWANLRNPPLGVRAVAQVPAGKEEA